MLIALPHVCTFVCVFEQQQQQQQQHTPPTHPHTLMHHLPTQVTFIGSDGQEHAFLAKPKDDLRKDSRMMEAAGVLNTMLAQDPCSRRRGLDLRRFAVAPLTEECGLVEWVFNTHTFRNCCQEVYMAEGLFDSKYTNPKIKHMYEKFPVREGVVRGGVGYEEAVVDCGGSVH